MGDSGYAEKYVRSCAAATALSRVGRCFSISSSTAGVVIVARSLRCYRWLRPLWLRPNVRSAALSRQPWHRTPTVDCVLHHGGRGRGGSMIVGVVGAGTMGSGIAQVAARAGHRALVFDAEPGRAAKACAEAVAGFERLRARGSLSTDEAAAAEDRLVAAGTLDDLAGCGLV